MADGMVITYGRRLRKAAEHVVAEKMEKIAGFHLVWFFHYWEL